MLKGCLLFTALSVSMIIFAAASHISDMNSRIFVGAIGLLFLIFKDVILTYIIAGDETKVSDLSSPRRY